MSVEGITTIELSSHDVWEKYHLNCSGGQIKEDGFVETSFFKKINLSIPNSYLSLDKEAKIKEIISTITRYNRELINFKMAEKKFLLSKPAEGNYQNQRALTSFMQYITFFQEALKKIENLSVNGITYKLDY